MDRHIGLGAGGGGRMQRDLIEAIRSRLSNPLLDRLEDGAVITMRDHPGRDIVFTTDSYVVQPLVFPGGDIGSLAVCGTVNDLAVMGAVPKYISLAFIIEEGFALDRLETVLDSISRRADEAGVSIVTGDTKVVERGKCDGLFINTAGIGIRPPERDYGSHRIAPGQALVVSGELGDHSIAVMLSREGMDFEVDAQSDCAPLNGMIGEAIRAVGADSIYAMRDLTRGGLAAALNEFAESAQVDIGVEEDAVPVAVPVRSAARVLGFEPYVLANEGKVLLVVDEDRADDVVSALKNHKYGANAVVIGRVGDRFDRDNPPKGRPRRPLVFFNTPAGGVRVVEMPLGELLPRIC